MTHGNAAKTARKQKIKKKKFIEVPRISNAKPENSRHKEDFERLLDDASLVAPRERKEN